MIHSLYRFVSEVDAPMTSLIVNAPMACRSSSIGLCWCMTINGWWPGMSTACTMILGGCLLVGLSSDETLKIIETGFFHISFKYNLFSTGCSGSSWPGRQTGLPLCSLDFVTETSSSVSILRLFILSWLKEEIFIFLCSEWSKEPWPFCLELKLCFSISFLQPRGMAWRKMSMNSSFDNWRVSCWKGGDWSISRCRLRSMFFANSRKDMVNGL